MVLDFLRECVRQASEASSPLPLAADEGVKRSSLGLDSAEDHLNYWLPPVGSLGGGYPRTPSREPEGF